MNLKDLAGIYEDARNGKVTFEQVSELRDCLTVSSDKAREIILQRINEQEFVKVRSLLKRTILAVMMSNDESGSAMLTAVDLSDGNILNGLLDTYFLATLGLFIQDEIL